MDLSSHLKKKKDVIIHQFSGNWTSVHERKRAKENEINQINLTIFLAYATEFPDCGVGSAIAVSFSWRDRAVRFLGKGDSLVHKIEAQMRAM